MLDNCEHVVAACADLAHAILTACPQVCILATSREVLAVSGEAVWVTPPLSTPEESGSLSLADLATYEATRLFIERATAGYPELALAGADVPAVATVCGRLDGMPLAIELAAARVRVLTVHQIAENLGERFRLLTSGSRDAPQRQRSLRETIAWSYNLLSPEEQAMLRRLSVFVGGFWLPAAAAVCTGDGEGGDEAQTLDNLSRLVDKSLVVAESRFGEARYRLLETVRMYAWERLAEAGEQDAVVRRFVSYWPGWTRAVDAVTFGSESTSFAAAIHRFDLEHDNLRAALTWSVKTGQHRDSIWIMMNWDYWTWRGEDVSEFQSYIQSPLPVAQWDLQTQAIYYFESAVYARARGDLEFAFRQVQARLDVVRQMGRLGQVWGLPSPVAPEVHAWAWLGRMALSMDRFDEAERCFAEARLALASTNKEPLASSVGARATAAPWRSGTSAAGLH